MTLPTSWTSLPRAAALLADIAQSPPASRPERFAGLVHDVTRTIYDPADPRVVELEAITTAWDRDVWSKLLADIAGNGGYDHLLDINPTAQQAIKAAIRSRLYSSLIGGGYLEAAE